MEEKCKICCHVEANLFEKAKEKHSFHTALLSCGRRLRLTAQAWVCRVSHQLPPLKSESLSDNNSDHLVRTERLWQILQLRLQIAAEWLCYLPLSLVRLPSWSWDWVCLIAVELTCLLNMVCERSTMVLCDKLDVLYKTGSLVVARCVFPWSAVCWQGIIGNMVYILWRNYCILESWGNIWCHINFYAWINYTACIY